MSTIKHFSPAGEPAADTTIADTLLELDKGDQAVRDAVVATMNALRAGTASTLKKGEVAGSNKKPWRQKGTGRARAGLRQSPVWRGGGVAFGPHPRSYDNKVNRKVAQLAFRRVLSAKIQDGSLVVIERFDLAEAKTKALAGLLTKVGLGRGGLIVVDRSDETLLRASRNLPKVAVVRAADVGVYELVRHRKVLATRAGFEALTARMAKKAEVAA